MIVKVQLSLNGGQQQVLVYDQARSIVWQGVAEPDVIDLMAGREKAFFEARVLPDARVSLDYEVAAPPW